MVRGRILPFLWLSENDMILEQILVSFLALGLCVSHGTGDDIRQNPAHAAGTYYVYYYDSAPELDSAPEGFQPFYISHFGRHGARHCAGEYDSLYGWLSKAAGADLLTDKGRDLFLRYGSFYSKVRYCKGNLTNIGKAQHRAVARHMFERFPEVFDGHTVLDAKSTEVARVIMSMWSCISELQSLDSDLDIKAEASACFAPWMSPSLYSNPYLVKNAFKIGGAAEETASEYFNGTVPWKKILKRFFVSVDVPQKDLGITPEKFISTLYSVVCCTRCLDEDRDCFDDVFSDDEMYRIWKGLNVRFFMDYANYEDSECLAMDYAAFTLRNIIESANADIASGEKGLQLRFGHDSGIAPLLALMDVNGFGRRADTVKDIFGIFPSYNIPMGASLQLVLYKNQDAEILVRILLNECEASLPLTAVKGSFYSWEEFKAHYMPVIEASEMKIQRLLSEEK